MKVLVEERTRDTFVLFGMGDNKPAMDVLALFTFKPEKADIDEVILGLPMFTYSDFHVQSYAPGSRVNNARGIHARAERKNA